jgi:hypothetical protein
VESAALLTLCHGVLLAALWDGLSRDSPRLIGGAGAGATAHDSGFALSLSLLSALCSLLSHVSTLVSSAVCLALSAGIGPGWTRGKIEAPAGEKNMGTWCAAVYTEEQQARLGVDETGDATDGVIGSKIPGAQESARLSAAASVGNGWQPYSACGVSVWAPAVWSDRAVCASAGSPKTLKKAQ